MPVERTLQRDLLDGAKQLCRLHAPSEILGSLCRGARNLSLAHRAFATYLPPGQPWERGLRVSDGEGPSAAASSALFAIHRRLAQQREPLRFDLDDPANDAIARGLGIDGARPSGDSSAVWAVPVVHRTGRLIGIVVLVADAPSDEVLAAVEELAQIASIALENAQRLAFARHDQDRLLVLSEASEEALWDWSLDTGAFWFGGGIQRILGGGVEVVGTTVSWRDGRVHPEDAPRVGESLRAARESTASSWQAEYRFRRTDGSWAVVEDRGYFLRDASGRAYRMIGALRDISARRCHELQQAVLLRVSGVLAESLAIEDNLRAAAQVVVEAMAERCVIVLHEPERDPRTTVVLAPAAAPQGESLRAAVEAELARTGELHPWLTEPCSIADLAAHPDPPEAARVLTSLGARSVLAAPLRAGGRVLGAILLVSSGESKRIYRPRDVAFVEELARRCASAVEKARLYEQAQEAIRARDAFMAILGHELRNPLSPITTALHLMKLRDPRCRREQEVIERQVKHLTRLVDDLLDVSRVERGKVELDRKPVQLAEIVAKAVEIASPLLEERRHRLDLQVPVAGLLIHADETRAAQVVANLLTNAARYTDSGGNISVRAEREGAEVVLRVRDDGIGMAPDLIPRVFDLFVQGARSPDRQHGGLGLGLTLVRSLVVLHGGRVEAHSDGPGKGSEFVVRLPAMPLELVPAHRAEEPRPSRIVEARSRILLVDDNADAAEMLGEVLRAFGHHVEVVHDGPGALDLAREALPDVAILDIGLPVMDGYELAGRLAALSAPSRRPYLIALTGYGQAHDRARARDAGFDEHVVKPVEPQVLVTMIEDVARQRRSRGLGVP